MKRLICLLTIVTAFTQLNAQVSFQFVPELNGRNVDGLTQVRIINPGAQLTGDLVVKVTEKTSGEVVRLYVNNITVGSGFTSLNTKAVSRSSVAFASNNVARVIRQSNFFPEGEYNYCFTLQNLKTSGGGLIGEDCFNYHLEPFSPLSLVEPFNTQRLCDKKPAFVWQPVFPAVSGLQYQLTMTEVKEGQSATEALFYNIPVINTRNINGGFLLYPPSAKDLDTSRKYVWQVTAYTGQTVISRSEVWTFRYGCQETEKPQPIDGYRNIENLVLGNYYIAEGRIAFSLDNAYSETGLKYTVTCLTDPKIEVKKLPEIKLQRGKNNVLIELENGKYFKDGYHYMMDIHVPGGGVKSLRFIYKKN